MLINIITFNYQGIVNMKKSTLLICIFLLLIIGRVKSQSKSNLNSEIYLELDSLSKTLGYEFVFGDRYPINNPYGSYGSTSIFDVTLGTENHNVLFLVRKANKLYQKKRNYSARELTLVYDYALIFAIQSRSSSSYKIQNVIKDKIGLKGMYLHYATFNKELSDFTSLSTHKKGPKGKFADYRSGAFPIFISSESAFVVLYNYKGQWYEYDEIEN